MNNFFPMKLEKHFPQMFLMTICESNPMKLKNLALIIIQFELDFFPNEFSIFSQVNSPE